MYLSLYWEVTSLFGVLLPKIETYFLEIVHIMLLKNREFYADFKNVNIPQWQMLPIKLKFKKGNNWDFVKFGI
jgi:hypothetical protein